jgi:hypothetical protein
MLLLLLLQTTRNGQPASGPSMVCCVFVCHMWKAAGMFTNLNDEVWRVPALAVGSGVVEHCCHNMPLPALCVLCSCLCLCMPARMYDERHGVTTTSLLVSASRLSLLLQVNCGELTNWDDYVLNIFDPTPALPSQCKSADPTNPLCQLTGQYSLQLNDYATKTPYAHMAEQCPSEAPLYNKPSNC